MPADSSDRELDISDLSTLGLLSVIEEDETVTQRALARRIGIALGLANSLLKRAHHKGLIKIKQAPAKRYAYYITPEGFREKSRLVAEYLSSSLAFFRRAREGYDQVFTLVATRGYRRIVLFGHGELAEIATLSASGSAVEIVGVIAPGSNYSVFHGLPLYQHAGPVLASPDTAIVITDSADPQAVYDSLISEEGHDRRVFAPTFLKITATERRGG